MPPSLHGSSVWLLVSMSPCCSPLWLLQMMDVMNLPLHHHHLHLHRVGDSET